MRMIQRCERLEYERVEQVRCLVRYVGRSPQIGSLCLRDHRSYLGGRVVFRDQTVSATRRRCRLDNSEPNRDQSQASREYATHQWSSHRRNICRAETLLYRLPKHLCQWRRASKPQRYPQVLRRQSRHRNDFAIGVLK